MKWGLLAAINLYDCNSKLIKNKKEIKKFIIDLCNLIKMKRFGPARIRRFGEGKLEGYSAMQFVETSSITLHFDEEKNRAFIDIFSCKDFDSEETEKFCKDFFKAGKSTKTVLIRD